jgi:hypothetical protein
MRVSFLEIHEGAKLPWWGGVWRVEHVSAYAYILPIPLCWIARLFWNLWCWTYQYRPNSLEQSFRVVRARAFDEAYSLGVKEGEQCAIRKIECFINQERDALAKKWGWNK